MNLSCQFGDFAIIIHSRLVHHNHLEVFTKNTGKHKIGFAYCTRFVVQVNSTQLVFHIRHTGVPSIPAWHFLCLSVSVTIVVGYF